MRSVSPPPDDDSPLFDPHVPGRARIIYIAVVVLVVLALVVGLGGAAVWDRLL